MAALMQTALTIRAATAEKAALWKLLKLIDMVLLLFVPADHSTGSPYTKQDTCQFCRIAIFQGFSLKTTSEVI